MKLGELDVDDIWLTADNRIAIIAIIHSSSFDVIIDNELIIYDADTMKPHNYKATPGDTLVRLLTKENDPEYFL